MRRTVIAALLMSAITGSAVACSIGSEPVSATVLGVDCATLESAALTGAPVAEDVTIATGQQLLVTLCSNPSTGFAWEDPSWEGDPTLELVNREPVQPVDAPPGAPGQEMFTFSAIAAGTSVVHFVYSQPWAGGIKGAWLVDLTVDVD